MKIKLEIDEIRKVCKDNKLVEQVLKVKNNVAEAKKIIDDKISPQKATKELVKNYIIELELDSVRKLCKEKNLNDKIKGECVYDVKKSLKILDAELPEGDKGFLSEAVLKHIEELKLDEVRTKCKEENLNKQIVECAGNFKKIKETIVASLPEGRRTILEDAVKEYVVELELEVIQKICKEKGLNEKIKAFAYDFQKTTDIISAELPKGNKVSSDAVKKYIEELKENTADEAITEQVVGDKRGILISENELKEFEAAKAENIQLKKDNALLTSEKDKLKKENEILKQELNGTSVDKNNIFAEIPELNELLNSNKERISVTINKELLSMSTRFVDNKSLVKLESIIREGSDLSSTVVQSILLAFIKQNSLYKFDKNSN